jgi:hypothetical protein
MSKGKFGVDMTGHLGNCSMLRVLDILTAVVVIKGFIQKNDKDKMWVIFFLP